MSMQSLYSQQSPSDIEQLGDMNAEVHGLKGQGMSDAQIAQHIQSMYNGGNIPAPVLYAMLQNIQKNSPPVPQPSGDSVAVQAAKKVLQDAQAKQQPGLNVQQLQAMFAQPPPQQGMPPAPPGAPMPQGSSPQPKGPPQQAPPPKMREGGLADLPTKGLGSPKAYAAGGIVAFDDGGSVQHMKDGGLSYDPTGMGALASRIGTSVSDATSYLADLYGRTDFSPYSSIQGAQQSPLAVPAALIGKPASANPYSVNPLNNAKGFNVPNTPGVVAPAAVSNTTGFQEDTSYDTPAVNTNVDEKRKSVLINLTDRTRPNFDDNVDNLEKLEKQFGIPAAYDAINAKLESQRGVAGRLHEQALGAAQDLGQAAQVKQASLMGNMPGYAGRGLSGLLASLGANKGATAEATLAANKDYAASMQGITKQEVDAQLAEQTRRSQNVKSLLNYGKEDLKDWEAAERFGQEYGLRHEEAVARLAQLRDEYSQRAAYQQAALAQRGEEKDRDTQIRFDTQINTPGTPANKAYKTYISQDPNVTAEQKESARRMLVQLGGGPTYAGPAGGYQPIPGVTSEKVQ